jgi:oligoribonuclease (3'-5' exoribonuclease)
MRYVSIDIETTGLSPVDNQMIEIGLVIEDTVAKKHIDELPRRRVLVPSKQYQINTSCMNLHRTLFEKLDQVDWDKLERDGSYRHSPKTYFSTPEYIEAVIAPWLRKHICQDKKFVVAGKNFYGFDYNFLKPWLPNVRFHHRALDPCTLYVRPEDVVPPDLPTCCKRAGINIDGYHTAVGDALTVIKLLRGSV